MKMKIILGFLVLVVLLCFLAQSWAIDWRRAQQQYYERPDQEFDRVPVTPQASGNYPSFIKFMWLPSTQNLPTLILIEKSTKQVPLKVEMSVRNLSNPSVKTFNRAR